MNFSLSARVASDPIGPGYTGNGDGGDPGNLSDNHDHRDRLIAVPVWDQPYYF